MKYLAEVVIFLGILIVVFESVGSITLRDKCIVWNVNEKREMMEMQKKLTAYNSVFVPVNDNGHIAYIYQRIWNCGNIADYACNKQIGFRKFDNITCISCHRNCLYAGRWYIHREEFMNLDGSSECTCENGRTDCPYPDEIDFQKVDYLCT